MLLSAAVALACGKSADRPGGAPVSVTATVDGPAAEVEVGGVDRTALRRLARLAPNDSVWTNVVGVYVERDASDAARAASAVSPSPPAVIGRYSVTGDRVEFRPRFPFAAGVSYRVHVDTAALRRLAEHSGATLGPTTTSPLVYRFSSPAATRARTTRVVGVHPSATRVPSNLLRWYVDFSAPMEPGSALAHVHLLDESGREVRGAFLALDQELWDPARRRLTLLFDPGRVKRGVRTNLEAGAPLVAGRRYRLVIDNGWLDGDGAALASGFEHAFEAVAADRQSPKPAWWRLTLPAAGARSGLGVAFGEPLDHALASRMLAVYDTAGQRVPGAVSLASDDSLWQFLPDRPWQRGAYALRVNTALEDVAGNSVARVFDADMLPNTNISVTAVDSVASVRFHIP
jgi:hypothetical protein